MRARGLPEINGNFEGPIGAGVPAEVRDGERLLAPSASWPTTWTGRRSRCLLHGDAHIGNLYLECGRTTVPAGLAAHSAGPVVRRRRAITSAARLSPEERRRTESGSPRPLPGPASRRRHRGPVLGRGSAEYRPGPAVRVLPLGHHLEGGSLGDHRDARTAWRSRGRPRGVFVGVHLMTWRGTSADPRTPRSPQPVFFRYPQDDSTHIHP